MAGRVLLLSLHVCFQPRASRGYPCKHHLTRKRRWGPATATRPRAQSTPERDCLKKQPKSASTLAEIQQRESSGQACALTTRESLIICTTTMWSFGFTRPTLELMLTASCSNVSPAHHTTPLSHHFCGRALCTAVASDHEHVASLTRGAHYLEACADSNSHSLYAYAAPAGSKSRGPATPGM